MVLKTDRLALDCFGILAFNKALRIASRSVDRGSEPIELFSGTQDQTDKLVDFPSDETQNSWLLL